MSYEKIVLQGKWYISTDVRLSIHPGFMLFSLYNFISPFIEVSLDNLEIISRRNRDQIYSHPIHEEPFL